MDAIPKIPGKRRVFALGRVTLLAQTLFCIISRKPLVALPDAPVFDLRFTCVPAPDWARCRSMFPPLVEFDSTEGSPIDWTYLAAQNGGIDIIAP